MHFKMIVAIIDDALTDNILIKARQAGATGATVINNARGEGIENHKTFFGLSLDTQRDIVLFLVEEHLCKKILETISEAGDFENKKGQGIALQIDVEDAVGLKHQASALVEQLEEEI